MTSPDKFRGEEQFDDRQPTVDGKPLASLLPEGVTEADLGAFMEGELSDVQAERVAGLVAAVPELAAWCEAVQGDRAGLVGLGAADAAVAESADLGDDLLAAAFVDAGWTSTKPRRAEAGNLDSGVHDDLIEGFEEVVPEPVAAEVEPKGAGKPGVLAFIGPVLGVGAALAAMVAVGVVLVDSLGGPPSGPPTAGRLLARQTEESAAAESDQALADAAPEGLATQQSPELAAELADDVFVGRQGFNGDLGGSRSAGRGDVLADGVGERSEKFADGTTGIAPPKGDPKTLTFDPERMAWNRDIGEIESVVPPAGPRPTGLGPDGERLPPEGPPRERLRGVPLLDEDIAKLARDGRLEIHLLSGARRPGPTGPWLDNLPGVERRVVLDRTSGVYDGMLRSLRGRMRAEERLPKERPYVEMWSLRADARSIERLRAEFERRRIEHVFYDAAKPLRGGVTGEAGWLWTQEGLRPRDIATIPVVRFIGKPPPPRKP